MRKTVFSIIIASIVGIFVFACSTDAKKPISISVDEDVVVALSNYVEGDSVNATPACLLEDTVRISELLYHSEDDEITVPFKFSDTTKYAEITEHNLEKKIAISINGRVVSTPVVKMRIENGACSATLPKSQILDIFPKVRVEDFNSIKN
jgi:hypothetical protein